MAFLSGRCVRQTIVDAFRPDGLFATARARAGTRLSKCVTRHRDDSYWRGFSRRYLWSGRIVHDSEIGPNGVSGALPANSASHPIDGSSHLERAPNQARECNMWTIDQSFRQWPECVKVCVPEVMGFSRDTGMDVFFSHPTRRDGNTRTDLLIEGVYLRLTRSGRKVSWTENARCQNALSCRASHCIGFIFERLSGTADAPLCQTDQWGVHGDEMTEIPLGPC